MQRFVIVTVLIVGLHLGFSAGAIETIDLRQTVVVTSPGDRPPAESAAATVLVEEFASRTGIALPTATQWPTGKTVIAITSEETAPGWDRAIPVRSGTDLPEQRAEGFRIFVDTRDPGAPTVWILGADPRGTLYGVGALLRNLDWAQGKARIDAHLDIATAPAYPIRGHQLGFRNTANSWDAWDVDQYDQYIRELAFFGINSVENIPFQGGQASPLMKVSRREMNRSISEICARYGLDYWIWTPADYDLSDAGARARGLDEHEALYRDCTELSGVFFPGGDPGNNPPDLVLDFLEDIAQRLLAIHPEAKVWMSMQGFDREEAMFVLDYLKTEAPTWFGGLVAGPSSPPVPITRNLLPARYGIRLYPDITHNKICQYPVPWWDQAFALTLGREAINPRPAQYAAIHNWFAPYSDGFISYSDGVHDDVNKTVWSALGWNPNTPVRDILVEYARVFLDAANAEAIADGILALEKNWRGPLIENGAVEGTLLYWQQLEKETPPGLASNWRWQLNLVRARYDAYVRRRLLNETALETEANAILAEAETRGADAAMADALKVLNRAVTGPVSPDLRASIFDLYEALFQSCGLQSSVEKYHASGHERGASLDFIDYPLNNRWWLEDEFAKISLLASESEKCERLGTLAAWEHPGFGSYYDDIGNAARSPHVKRSEEVVTEPGEEAHPEPTLWWWDDGKSRARLSWQTSMNYPEAVVYEGLDPNAAYTIRCSGYGRFLLRIDGELVGASTDRVDIGDVKDFPVPAANLHDRKLVLTWDTPTDEGHLNWRQHSRLAEVWLLKQ